MNQSSITCKIPDHLLETCIHSIESSAKMFDRRENDTFANGKNCVRKKREYNSCLQTCLDSDISISVSKYSYKEPCVALCESTNGIQKHCRN